MELLITSYGIAAQDYNPAGLFYRMPPVSMAKRFTPDFGFQPDYSALLLCDRIVIDTETLDRLLRGAYHAAYKSTAELLTALHSEGFLRVEDFSAKLKQKDDLLSEMLQADLHGGSVRWQKLLYAWAEGWEGFVQGDDGEGTRELEFWESETLFPHISFLMDERLDGTYSDQSFYQHAILSLLRSGRKGLLSAMLRTDGSFRRNITRSLLQYVNANLILSREYQIGIYDWSHFAPFYETKFLSVGHEAPPGHNEVAKIKQLFEVSFPEFDQWTPSRFLHVLRDKRIESLRRLVAGAVERGTVFDRDFAVRTLREVLWIEARTSRIRSIASYITLPIGFVPLIGTPVQKTVEEVADRLIDWQLKKEFRWFFLIGDSGKESPQLQSPTSSS